MGKEGKKKYTNPLHFLCYYQVVPISARKRAWKETRPGSLEISSSGSTLVSAPASAQRCTRALQEGGKRGWWKAINNTCVISQRDEEGKCMLHGDFKAGALDSIQGHFRECGHPVFTGIFLGCIQQTQAALQHACRETISTRNSVLVLPCRELWLHAHSYQNLATDTPTIIRLGYRNTDYYQTCRTCITFPKARQLVGVSSVTYSSHADKRFTTIFHPTLVQALLLLSCT